MTTEIIVFLERNTFNVPFRRPEFALAGAGIDVLRKEPPRNGNPLLEVDLPNLIVTPHNAWASRQAMHTLADQLIDNLEAFVRGAPQNLI